MWHFLQDLPVLLFSFILKGYHFGVNKDRFWRCRWMCSLMSLSLTWVFRRPITSTRNVNRHLCAGFEVSAALIDAWRWRQYVTSKHRCPITPWRADISQNKETLTLIRGGIQNIPDWCRHLSAVAVAQKNLSQQAKLWIPGATSTFCGDCVKTSEDVPPNFGENKPDCFTMTTPRLTLPSSPRNFRRNKKWLSSPTHRTPLIWHPVTSSYF
jgi:hypothetical protein